MKNLIIYTNLKQTMTMTKCNCKAFNKHFEFQHKQMPIVNCIDKGSKTKYIYRNNSSNFLSKYRVDGGLIEDNDAKCDYLLLNCDKKQSYFIEMKGSDLIQAINQIDRSINLLKKDLAGFSFFARIVLTRVNTVDLRDSRLMRLEKKVNSLNGNLKKQSRLLEDIV